MECPPPSPVRVKNIAVSRSASPCREQCPGPLPRAAISAPARRPVPQSVPRSLPVLRAVSFSRAASVCRVTRAGGAVVINQWRRFCRGDSRLALTAHRWSLFPHSGPATTAQPPSRTSSNSDTSGACSRQRAAGRPARVRQTANR